MCLTKSELRGALMSLVKDNPGGEKKAPHAAARGALSNAITARHQLLKALFGLLLLGTSQSLGAALLEFDPNIVLMVNSKSSKQAALTKLYLGGKECPHCGATVDTTRFVACTDCKTLFHSDCENDKQFEDADVDYGWMCNFCKQAA